MMQTEAEVVELRALCGEQLDDPRLDCVQLGEWHQALGGAGLVGDADKAPAGVDEAPQRGRCPGDKPHIRDAERRFRPAAYGIRNQLVDDAVAVDKDSGTIAAQRRSAAAGDSQRPRRAFPSRLDVGGIAASLLPEE